MCDFSHSGGTLTHWNAAWRVASDIDGAYPNAEADRKVDEMAAMARRELELGNRPAIALARAAMYGLEIVDADTCIETSALLPHAVAVTGRGHEFACALVAVEVARRAAIDARLALSPDSAMLVVHDGGPAWSVLMPDFDGVSWVPMPASVMAEEDVQLRCPHDAARTLIQLASETLSPRQLPRALALLDELALH
jgi:hypothetical protein